MPELWQRLHPGFRLLPQLSDSLATHGKAGRARSHSGAGRTRGARRRRPCCFDEWTGRASAGSESDQPERFSWFNELLTDGGAERAAHGGGEPIHIPDDAVTVVH